VGPLPEAPLLPAHSDYRCQTQRKSGPSPFMTFVQAAARSQALTRSAGSRRSLRPVWTSAMRRKRTQLWARWCLAPPYASGLTGPPSVQRESVLVRSNSDRCYCAF